MAQSVITSTKRGHKKAMAEPTSIPVEMAIPLEERIHDQTSPSSTLTLHKENRQSMTARGYCCYYLEHCSKTNHIAIKGVIKRAKYENGFGLVTY